MKKILVLIFCLIFLVGCQNNQVSENVNDDINEVVTEEVEETASEITVDLTNQGRASVRLDFSDGTVIYIDPYAGSIESYEKEADLVLVTHQHSDHNVVDRVTLKENGEIVQAPMDIRAGVSREFGDIHVKAVEAYNSNHDMITSAGFVITYHDIVIYHSGDTSKIDEMKDFTKYDIDYALLCMDGQYNMGPEEAMKVAEIIDAEVVIPIHSSPGGEWDQRNVDAFTAYNKLEVKPDETVTLVDMDYQEMSFDEAIEIIMDERLDAIENRDYDLYMSHITLNNPYFFVEQERWYDNMTEDKISYVSFEILSTEIIDDKTAVVNIRQKHQNRQLFDFEYPLLFKYEMGEWKDHGYNFEIYEGDGFTVKYMEGETRVEEFADMLEAAFDNLDDKYEEKPHPYFEMKLFNDQEMLRQRCIPANEWVFTGWSEPDESLKVYTGHHPEYKGYPGLVQHEVVHHITIRIANNNLPPWLYEGVAMYDGSAQYGIELSTLLSAMEREHVEMTIMDLEAIDLAEVTDRQIIYNFYNTSYMYTRFISEVYGHDVFMDLFYEAGKKPFHEENNNDNFYPENYQTATEVIQTVFGMTKEELSNAYLKWLETAEIH